jgi:hypothetical protein
MDVKERMLERSGGNAGGRGRISWAIFWFVDFGDEE